MRTTIGESQREAGARLSGAVDASAANIREALDEWRKEGAIYSHRHETTADHLGLIVGTIEQLLDRIRTSLDQLPSAVDRFESHSTQAADRLRKHLDRFMADLPDTDSSTERITAQMAELQRSLDRLGERFGRLPTRRRRLRRWFGGGT
jgi:ABC-type transporter Mla subunit MlaD